MRKTLVENEYAIFELKESIVVGVLKSETMDLNVANRITQFRLDFQNGNAYPMLSNILAVKNSTKEARDFLASEKGCEGVIAAAILIGSYTTSMIGNFFLRVNKPVVPTKLFTCEEEAKKWLSQFVINK